MTTPRQRGFLVSASDHVGGWLGFSEAESVQAISSVGSVSGTEAGCTCGNATRSFRVKDGNLSSVKERDVLPEATTSAGSVNRA